jgi:hypothetical protein
MIKLSMRSAVVLAGLVLTPAASLAEQPPPSGCTNVPNGPTVCRNDSEVSVGGKTDEKGIREFVEYPLGKSPHSVPQDIGRGVEHVGQELGKIGRRIFKW